MCALVRNAHSIIITFHKNHMTTFLQSDWTETTAGIYIQVPVHVSLYRTYCNFGATVI